VNAGTAKNYELQFLEAGGSGQTVFDLRKTTARIYAMTFALFLIKFCFDHLSHATCLF